MVIIQMVQNSKTRSMTVEEFQSVVRCRSGQIYQILVVVLDLPKDRFKCSMSSFNCLSYLYSILKLVYIQCYREELLSATQ